MLVAPCGPEKSPSSGWTRDPDSSPDFFFVKKPTAGDMDMDPAREREGDRLNGGGSPEAWAWKCTFSLFFSATSAPPRPVGATGLKGVACASTWELPTNRFIMERTSPPFRDKMTCLIFYSVEDSDPGVIVFVISVVRGLHFRGGGVADAWP
jgi:hypothetical protein